MDSIDGPSEAIGYLNASVRALEERMVKLETTVNEQSVMIRHLLDIANVGKGAWFAVLKIGGIIAALAGGIAWIVNAAFHTMR